jgi:short-subunit dehydrogenase
MKKIKSRFGPWALITGSSSGIGAEFAQQLARSGLNLVLIARREDVLQRTAEQLSKTHGIKTRVIAADLSDPQVVDALPQKVADLDIGLVVSNAGSDSMGALTKVDPAVLRSMYSLNTYPHLAFTRHFSERMLKRKAGAIILVSSMAGMQGTAYGANYSASKAYILNLGEAVDRELRRTGVNLTVLVPGPTDTPAVGPRDDIDFSKMPVSPMKARPVVRGALQAVLANKAVYVPGLMNKVLAVMSRRAMSRGTASAMWSSLMKKAVPDHLKVTP